LKELAIELRPRGENGLKDNAVTRKDAEKESEKAQRKIQCLGYLEFLAPLLFLRIIYFCSLANFAYNAKSRK
jgi:hypothetical protein